MDSLKIIVGRIERRLRALNMKAATVSRDAGLSSSAIYNMQRGAKGKIPTKGGNASTFVALAPVLKSSANWLMTGEGPETVEDDDQVNPRQTVRLAGYVGAGAKAHFYEVSQDNLDEIPAPAGSTPNTVAVEVRGNSLGDTFNRRWLVFYDDVRSPVTPDLIGLLCVVGLTDERVLLKEIHRQRNGLYELRSEKEDPIRNAEIVWAAKVKTMVQK